MDVPASVYYKSNSIQRRDAEDLLKTYSSLLQWRDDGKDTVLDIGCGPGDVTIDFIAPLLPKEFRNVVGVDLSEDMVKHANFLSADSRISFQKWDMVGDVQQLLTMHPKGFDRVFSFYALHWHPNQRQILQNIYDLLTPGGDCFLVFLGRHDIYEVTLTMSRMPKWCEVTKNIEQLTIPFQYKSDRADIFRELLAATGFRSYSVVLSERKFVYNDLDEIKRNITAVNPFMSKMAPAQKQEYFWDYIKTICDLGMGEMEEGGKNCRFNSSYTLMIVHAQK